MRKTCVICGEPSGMYPLCRKHLQMKNEGLVVKCERCGKWYLTELGCDCQKEQEPEKELRLNMDVKFVDESDDVPEEVLDEENEDDDEEEYQDDYRNQCLTCGRDANGYWFCTECYKKFFSKTILLQIKGCTEVELLNENYSGQYTCADGHIVKSKSERDIDNYLFNHGIFHVYEKPFPIDGRKEHDIHPDFYLPKEDVYIEFWGYDSSNQRYTDSKNYKMDIYRQRKITLINLYEKTDANDIDAAMTRKLSMYEKGKINFEESDLKLDMNKNVFRGKR